MTGGSAQPFPAAASDEVAGLARDHVRLRSAAELLVRAAAGQQPMSPARVAVAVRDFVAQLERHLRTEEELLASRHAVGGTLVPGLRIRMSRMPLAPR